MIVGILHPTRTGLRVLAELDAASYSPALADRYSGTAVTQQVRAIARVPMSRSVGQVFTFGRELGFCGLARASSTG